MNGCKLLSHPGCLLSYHRAPERILPAIKAAIAERGLTVLVTHWWEFYREGEADRRLIEVLHETAEYLGRAEGMRVVSFEDVAAGRVVLE